MKEEFNTPPQQVDDASYEFKLDRQQRDVTVNGITIPTILTLESRWNYFNQANETQMANGLLVRDGDVSLINPDRHAAIGFLNINIKEHVHFWGGQQIVSGTHAFSDMRVIAFPRDTGSMHEDGTGPFKLLLDRNLKNPPYKTVKSFVRDGVFTCSSYIATPQQEAIEKLTSLRAQKGLTVFEIKSRRLQDPEKLYDVSNMNCLSTNPNIRDAFQRIFNAILLEQNLQLGYAASQQRLPAPSENVNGPN